MSILNLYYLSQIHNNAREISLDFELHVSLMYVSPIQTPLHAHKLYLEDFIRSG